MKFKFVPIDREYDNWELEHFEIVDCPLSFNREYPQGEYMIRGDKPQHRKTYWKIKNVWYLTNTVTRDNGHYYCDSTHYNLFPQLPEREWIKIKQVGWRRLNKIWQRHLAGYEHWIELRRLVLNVRKSFL